MTRTIEESKSRAVADPLLTREQVAAWLHVTPKSLPRLGVPCLDLGRRTKRYYRADVQAWLDTQRKNG